MRAKISFEVNVPEVGATDDEIMEWLRFELNDNGSMSAKNPLAKTSDVEPVFGTFEADW